MADHRFQGQRCILLSLGVNVLDTEGDASNATRVCNRIELFVCQISGRGTEAVDGCMADYEGAF